MRIGVLGGTFDPVHNGHLLIAEAAQAGLNLAEVVFVPAGRPWLKAAVSSAGHRLQMVRLAIDGKPGFKLCPLEVEHPGPSYTVDTIYTLGKQRPGEEMFFILGWDSLADLPRWRQSARLIQMCRLVAVPRPGFPAPDLAKLEAAIPGLSQRVLFLDMPEIDISASDIRGRVARGLPIGYLVPAAVERYIREHSLYKSSGGEG
ncbi:MAG: nicotinate-nucleotide adenylyltransferase [Chloroflexi bacterium]|nr:nicotinate-nucleotide adenylyltransferase [Chloroflexota bacterium]